jgi:hypothetical protein
MEALRRHLRGFLRSEGAMMAALYLGQDNHPTVVSATMQVYDTAECCTGRLCYSVMILRMYAIDSIALIYALEDVDDDTEPKRWAMVFATV